MKDIGRIAPLCLAALLLPWEASAQREVRPADFPDCDGYGAPGRTSDGMTRGASGLSAVVQGGSGTSQLRRTELRYGSHGIDICTGLLGSDRLAAHYTVRRANLVAARALHRLAAGETREALADLDLAQRTLGEGDPLTARSFQLGLRLVRAFALLQANDAAASAAESQAVLAARPYVSELALTAAKLQFAAARDWPTFMRNLREIARVDPNTIATLYGLALYRGEFEEALVLHPQIIISRPMEAEGPYMMPQRNAVIADQIVRRAEIDGAAAYAQQALGRSEAADATLAAARASLERSMAPPVPDFGRGRLTREQRDQHEVFLSRRPRAVAALDRWGRMVRFRRMVAEGNIAGVVANLEGAGMARNHAALDLFEAMGRAQPALRTEMAAAIAELREELARQVDDALRLNIQDLASRLPEPESVQRLPSYDAGGDRDFDANGYVTLPRRREGTVRLRFASARGSISVVNEMVVLRGAELARQGGHRGMVIVTRRAMIRSTTQYSAYGGQGPTVASGQEAEIEVAFVDPAALPAVYRDAPWRVLDPEAVWTALSPVYVRERQAAR